MNWIFDHYMVITAVITHVIAIATTIVAITPTQKDDTILAKVVSVLEKLSLVNKNEAK